VFAQPKLSDLACQVQAAAASELPAITSALPEDQRYHQPLPLSYAQQRLWFLQQLDERAGVAYLIPGALRLRGRLDEQAMTRALQRIVQRHEVLRTRLVQQEDGSAVQWIEPEAQLAVTEIDLSGHDHPEQAVLLRLEEEASSPFNLAQAPLIRAKLLRLGEQEHVLLVTLHHVISDGWSMGVMVREFSALYRAYVQGQDDPLAPLAVQYADYAVWQRRWLQGERQHAELHYWAQQLAGAPSLLELPTDRPRPAVQDLSGAHEPFELDPATSQALQALAARHGATLHMVVLAAWAVLLSRLSGQDDVVIGTPVANRTRQEVEPLIGFFINTVALRLRPHAHQSVGQFIEQVRQVALQAQDHQQLPFEQVIEAVNPQRSLAHSALFQVMLAWQNAPQADLELPGLQLQELTPPARTVKFDLDVTMQQAQGRIVGAVAYATALFDAATIRRWLGHWRTLVEQLVQDDARQLARLEWLQPQDREQLAGFNRTQQSHPCGSVHELFEAQAACTPDAVALEYEGQQLSYGQLEAQANQLARHLSKLGVGPDQRVAIALPRSLEMVVALLATLKAGGAYVPLDPAYPAERLRYMLQDSQPVVVLSTEALAQSLPLQGQALCCLDGSPQPWSLEPKTALGEPVKPHAAAYVIYTSGSTGQPKGVVIEHGSLSNFLHAMRREPGLSEQDVLLAVTTLSFDIAALEIYLPLVIGARLILARREDAADAGALADLIERHGVNVMQATPATWRMLVDSGWKPKQPVQALCGGEALSGVQAGQMLERVSALWNMYGPTEATVWSTCLVLSAHEAVAQTVMPIGRPLANTQIHILDGQGQEVPIGVAGEIHIGGVQVARGYLHRPGLTAQRFVADPYSGEPGARMYCTGDLGRWRVDGSIEYLGRNDHQVKVRGFRIELGEIEAALQACAGVREAMVLARGEGVDKQLVAYTMGDASPQALREALATRLPGYMVPTAYVQLDTLPLTPNGKLDRQALPDPQASAYGTAPYEAPQGELEAALTEIWIGLLGVTQVGRQDHFFELGGHSLLAVQLVSRMRAKLGVEVPLATVFAQPRLSDLAVQVQAAAASELPAITPALPEAQRHQQAMPLSYAQQRLWFLQQLDERAGVAYLIPGALRLRGRLDQQAMTHALQRIVQRHEVLRTRLVSQDDGSAVQWIESEAQLALTVINLSTCDHPEQAVLPHLEEEASTPFDLAQAPLIRARLLKLGEQEHVLLVTLHHVISDGWSMGVMVREFSALYRAYALGQDDPLAPLQVQYADYAAWQRRWLQGERQHAEVQYWARQLAGTPSVLELPTDRPRPAAQDLSGAHEPFELSPATSQALQALATRHGATLHMVVLAAWAVLLGRLSGQEDVVIGTPVANRTRQEVEPLIGFFVNTVALRLRPHARQSVSSFIEHVRQVALQAQDHQQLPFEQVIEAVNPQRSLAHSALFQVMLAWQNAPQAELELPGLQLQELTAPARTVKFDLDITMQQAQGRIVGDVAYATALFDATTIRRWLGHWCTLVEQWVQDDARELARLELLRPQDREQLAGFNRTEQSHPGGSIHALFEQQARQTPNAVALEYEDQRLTYAQLDARANQLARHLKKLGVGADQRVAIALPRSPELVVTLLATLKAGGAYVPLDPAYPTERLRYMLQDSQPVVVLSTEALAQSLQLQGHALCCLDGAQQPWALEPESAPGQPVRPHDAAYVIYTSGSTGQPKGVAVEHRSVVNYCVAIAAKYVLTGADRMLHASSISFDIAVEEIFGAMSAGATLVLPPWERLPGIAEFEQLIERRRLSVLSLPTAYWHEWVAAREQLALGSLRLVIVGGESVSAHRLQQWHERAAAHTRWLNSYGPTETTVCVSFAELRPGEPVHIGRPMANMQIHILDDQGREVPIGVAGEIHIGGVQVARGYLHRPGLTAQRFVADPYSSEPGARMYRTGDLGRWRDDGSIEYLGRNDHQVKIRGFRIELGEIEAALQACAGVREAVVLARGEGEHKQLVAYITGDAAPQALREALAARLPGYMVPTAYVPLDTLPLTPNGKLDRQALPHPQASAYGATLYEAPQGELETALAQIWSGLLGVSQVGRQDHFFELGGHSLLAVQLVSRIRVKLGVEVPLAAVFAHPKLSDLACQVQVAAMSELPPITPALPKGRRHHQPLALSYAQQRLWFLQQLDERAGVAYLMPGALRLRGELDKQAMTSALQRILQRHEVLRTRLVQQEDGSAVQWIEPEAQLPLTVTDLSGHDHPEQAVLPHLEEEASTPFDLAQAPLIRAKLLKLGEQEHVLLVTLHHVISDGWSMGVMVREFATLYRAYALGQDDPLAPLAVQYADYAVWQRRWLQGERQHAELQYWARQLAGAPGLLELPTDQPRPAVQDLSGAHEAFELDTATSQALQALATRHGATLHMVVLAAWAVLLSRLSGQDDVVIGTPVANRTRQEVEPLIGFFVNTVALRVKPHTRQSVGEFIEQVKQVALQAQQHQQLPFEQVIEAVNPQRSLAHSALFQVMLAWQNAPQAALELPGLQLQELAAPASTVKFDLDITMQQAEGRIVGTVAYATALFDASTISRWLGHWHTLVEQWVQDDARELTRLQLLRPQDRDQLASFNSTQQPYPGGSIHELFEAQAARTPNAVALEYEGQPLSYARLDARANQLARHLKKLGVRANERVAIALPRSLELVVALLATLKAGGAYVPLDPSYPADRLRHMLQDSQPAVVLSTEALAQSLPLQGQTLCCLDEAQPLWSEESEAPLNEAVRAHDAAYVIYTSGSTGQPKGVVVEHRGVVNLWAVLEQRIYSRHETVHRVSLNASTSFDASVQQWVHLASGRTLVLVPEDVRKDGQALRRWMREQRIDVLDTTPSQWMLMGSARELGVKVVLVGGEAVSSALWDEFTSAEAVSGYNVYGPTECTVDATCAPMTEAGDPSIGSPLANTQIHILDEQGQEVPIGVAGEIHIGGVQVARGYLHRPGLTAQRFVADPYSGEPGARMYRTGDLGRWRVDGRIEYLGRNDHQVKIRGFRIELGEIEAALQGCDGVREAVVLARGEGAQAQLVAYTTGDALPQALRVALAARLPGHMVPTAYVSLDTLPLTPNGKLDRQALPDPQTSAYAQAPYEAPQGEVEQGLAQIWSELLGVQKVGRHDHFFELGGHSLLAVKVAAQAQARGYGLTLQDIYMAPVLSAQALRFSAVEQRPDLRVQVVRRHGDHPPLHAMPTGLGDTTYAFELAQHIGLEMPMYAHPWPQHIPSTWEQLARETAESIRSVQPTGPYRLLGYSSGGRLAYAAAVELERSGETVEFVGLIDCHAELARSAAFDRGQYLRTLIEDYLRSVIAQARPEGAAIDDASRMLVQVSTMATEHELLAWMRQCEPLHAMAARLHTSVEQLMQRAVAAVDVMAADHQSPWLDRLSMGVVQVFFAVEGNPEMPTLGWERAHGSSVRAVAVPGRHESLMKPPHVSMVGAKVEEAIRRARVSVA
jgi:amino acid adenylation domain-containing protein